MTAPQLAGLPPPIPFQTQEILDAYATGFTYINTPWWNMTPEGSLECVPLIALILCEYPEFLSPYPFMKISKENGGTKKDSLAVHPDLPFAVFRHFLQLRNLDESYTIGFHVAVTRDRKHFVGRKLSSGNPNLMHPAFSRGVEHYVQGYRDGWDCAIELIQEGIIR